VENAELLRIAKERQTLLEMLSTTGQISQRLNSNSDVDQILAEFVEACHFLLDARQCSILEVDWETEALRLLEGDAYDRTDEALSEVDLYDSIAGWVARTGQATLVPDVTLDSRYNKAVDAVAGDETRQLMCVPLSVQGRVLGIVQATNKISGGFDDLDLNLLQLVATNVAIALENARYSTQQQAEAEQKAELYSVASHGLRSPLMSILTSVDWILETGVQDEAHKARLEDIRAQTFNLASFAGGILDMSRIEMGHLRIELVPVAVTVFTKKILATFERRAPAHRFEMQANGNIPPVRADETQLTIILDHLLENAVKYSPEGSLVRVEAVVFKDQVLVSVYDQGCGIPDNELESVFTRFYRGQEQQSGKGHSLGLGLYITQKLVQAQGGQIWVESEVGHGSCFTFTLPQEAIEIRND
jgi:K+-sensing histidine kinase KdpD